MTAIALVAGAGGFGDHAFNDAAADALAACRRETNVGVSTAEATSDRDLESQLVLFATAKKDTVIGIGYAAAPPMAITARRFEDSHFAIVDAIVDAPNVESVTFDEAQGAFLAGALAASVSKSHHVAFIGGADVPLEQRSEAGFTAGAREGDPRVRVTTRYLTSFEDEAAGRSAANDLLAGGADVIFVVAGRAGIGSIAAIAAKPGAFAIGADNDQSSLAPRAVLTSVVKGVGQAVLTVCRETVAGKTQSGHHVMGLASGGIGLAPFAPDAHVSRAIAEKLERFRAAIVAHRIAVPDSRAALARFVPGPLP